MSLKSVLATIEKDVNEGLAIAGQVVTIVDPPIGSILQEVATVVSAIEKAIAGGASSPAPATVSNLVQAATSVSALKTAVAAPPAS